MPFPGTVLTDLGTLLDLLMNRGDRRFVEAHNCGTAAAGSRRDMATDLDNLTIAVRSPNVGHQPQRGRPVTGLGAFSEPVTDFELENLDRGGGGREYCPKGRARQSALPQAPGVVERPTPDAGSLSSAASGELRRRTPS